MLRTLRMLESEGVVNYGQGGRGHCLDGTSENGERLILALTVLEGATKYDKILKQIELQRFIRDKKLANWIEDSWDESGIEYFFRTIGMKRPPRWLFDHVSDEHKHYIVDKEPADTRFKSKLTRRAQWTLRYVQKGFMLALLDESKTWMNREDLVEKWLGDCSNSRKSQVLSELVRDGLIIRKRGPKRGEMLYLLTEGGAEYAKEWNDGGGSKEFLQRTLPYAGSWVNKP